MLCYLTFDGNIIVVDFRYNMISQGSNNEVRKPNKLLITNKQNGINTIEMELILD